MRIVIGTFICSILLLLTLIGDPLYASSMNIQKINTNEDLSVRINTIQQILYSPILPFDLTHISVLLDGFQREPRGRMKDGHIYLSPYVIRDSEFVKLFIHEFAHYIDIYLLVGNRVQRDPSEDFYAISWTSATIKRANQQISDFVSGYATTNQYEDFAESLVMYLFHNETFAERGLKSDILRQKYLFFANTLFRKGQFQGTDYTIGIVPSYVWDTTKIPFYLQKYLYSL